MVTVIVWGSYVANSVGEENWARNMSINFRIFPVAIDRGSGPVFLELRFHGNPRHRVTGNIDFSGLEESSYLVIRVS